MADGTRVWFMTGASRGFGWAFTEAAARAGDIVVATARQADALEPLVKEYGDRVVPMTLDVTSKVAVDATVASVLDRFGRVDIVVNNAGYGLRGAVEEITEAEARALMEVNFFGALWVSKAVLPSMRTAGSGHIVQVSSTSGHITFPGLSMYHASKWALEGFTESLAQEITPFGIKVTLIEPGAFRTDWRGSSIVRSAQMAEYGHLPLRDPDAPDRVPPGDPVKAAAALMQIVNDPNPPLRVLFGAKAFDMVQEAYHRRLVEWDEWKAVSRSTEWTGDTR